MTPRPKENPDILLPTGAEPKPMSSAKFKKLLEKEKALGKLDREDFNSAKEVGQFLDFKNSTMKEEKEKKADGEITTISEKLANMITRSLIFTGRS